MTLILAWCITDVVVVIVVVVVVMGWRHALPVPATCHLCFPMHSGSRNCCVPETGTGLQKAVVLMFLNPAALPGQERKWSVRLLSCVVGMFLLAVQP